ncbi:MAG: hypothetical protein ACREDR_16515 [Blastocatellia bacterium]
MSMTGFQLEGLRLLGYTKRESEFLFLVATHSGYFTNRQFKSFAQTESGSISHAFIRKLLERKHATYHAYRSGSRVYHVFARKVYQAIERENLRTRKKHELEYVKTRLVALDFVLGHPRYRYLETEAEKIAFFEKEYNVGRETLPVKMYRARKSAEVTPRYFVDRFPIFVNLLCSPASVTFTYVDAAAVALDSFGTYLRAYAGLFNALSRFDLLYIAPTARLFKAAESEFQRALWGRKKQSISVNVLEYFRVRKAWDSRERVASADVVLLKEAQVRYAGGEFEDLYKGWCRGIIADADVARSAEQPLEANKATFRTLLCGSSLKVFTDPRAGSADSWAERDSTPPVPQVSGNASVQISGS